RLVSGDRRRRHRDAGPSPIQVGCGHRQRREAVRRRPGNGRPAHDGAVNAQLADIARTEAMISARHADFAGLGTAAELTPQAQPTEQSRSFGSALARAALGPKATEADIDRTFAAIRRKFDYGDPQPAPPQPDEIDAETF